MNLPSGGSSSSASWYVGVVIDLTKRDALGKLNSSPVTTMDAYVEISSSCGGLQTLQIPVSDADGDDVKCFCTNNKCVSIMTLDSNTCIITFQPVNGYYAVDITIQDFSPGTSVAKSSVPLQFITYVNPSSTNCRNFFYLNLSNFKILLCLKMINIISNQVSYKPPWYHY